MRMKTPPPLLREFFLLPFSLLSYSPLCCSLSLSLTLPPFTPSPFNVLPLHTVPLSPYYSPLSFPLPLFCFYPNSSLPLSVFAPFRGWGGVGSLLLIRSGPKTSACLHCSQSICHQGVHCSTCMPLPSGAELETVKCVSSILLFFKSQTMLLPNVI